MSHTNYVRTTSKNQRGRGKAQGRNQHNRNNNPGHSNYSNPNIFQAGYNPSNLNSRRGEEDWVFLNNPGHGQLNRGSVNNPGHGQPSRGRVNNPGHGQSSRGSANNPRHGQSSRDHADNPGYGQSNRGCRPRQPNQGKGNFKNNNFNGENPKRPHSSSSTSSSLYENNTNLQRQEVEMLGGFNTFGQPSHTQNPIFVGLLKQRFDSILPKSRLLTSETVDSLIQPLIASEAPNFMQTRSPPTQSSFDDSQTFASISSNIGYGFRNRNPNHKNTVDVKNNTDRNGSRRSRSCNRLEERNSTLSLIDSSTIMSSERSQPAVSGSKRMTQPRSNYNSPYVRATNNSRFTSNNSLDDFHPERQRSNSIENRDKKSLFNSIPFGVDNNGSLQLDDTKHNKSDLTSENNRQFSEPQQSQCNFSTLSNSSKLKIKSTEERQSRINKIPVTDGYKPIPGNVTARQNQTTEINIATPLPNGNTIGSALFSELNKFRSRKKSLPEQTQPNLSQSASEINNLPFDLSLQLENFYRINHSQEPSPSDSFQQGARAGRKNRSEEFGDLNTNSATHNEQGLNQGAVAGPLHFNINRTVADANERAPTRIEALQRIQFEYERQKVEYEAKEKEKATKKKEQYLARYKHVDQGYRLNEPYLEDPTGHAAFLASQEEARQRQQQQLQLEALLNRQQEKEKLEQEKKRKEDKQKNWLKKHEHLDAGHRLGHGKTQGPDLLLEGETIEDARIRQQEQLILETLIYNENVKSDPKKKAEEVGKEKSVAEQSKTALSENRKLLIDKYLDEAAGYGDDFLLNGESVDEALIRQQAQILREMMKYKEELRTDNSTGGGEEKTKKAEMSSPVKQNQRKSRMAPRFDNQDQSSADQKNSATGSIDGRPVPPVEKSEIKMGGVSQQYQEEEDEDIEKEKERLLARLAMLMLKPSKSTKVQEPKTPQTPPHTSKPPEVSTPIKPASCVLKNATSGPVLVLRPSEEDLNHALVQRLEVQDEMDRHGTSAVYKCQTEKKPLYINNRYDWKPQTEEAPTGAAFTLKPAPTPVIKPAVPNVPLEPSKTPTPVIKPAVPNVPLEPSKTSTSVSKPAEESEIDYQAEIRAVRLRMQQKYEEALKKQQENAQ